MTVAYLQPPVGNDSYAGLFSRCSAEEGDEFSDVLGRPFRWFASGTMALAAAVSMACRRAASSTPRVVVPGYGCPDLVSAVHFAGAEPLYVDVAEGCFTLDRSKLADTLTRYSNVVAVIGVDLFGVEEDWDALHSLAATHGVMLIRDSAQSIQCRAVMSEKCPSDVRIFSFGRGKPVCCMGGGSAAVRADLLDEFDASNVGQTKQKTASVFRFRLRNSIYNAAIKPRSYFAVAAVMGERIGVTRYKPLLEVSPLAERLQQPISQAVSSFWKLHRDVSAELAGRIAEVTQNTSTSLIRLPPQAAEQSHRRWLNRLPLFVGSTREKGILLERLHRHGVGATCMYGRVLPDIVAEYFGLESSEVLENADALARELITLPVHARLRAGDVESIVNSVRDINRKSESRKAE